ncbi:hypothetical protein KCE62_003514 [Salmonella enterica subsp. enterica serovar Newport]|uniref:DUF1627 domain-containing protein n=2 Tax=Salmonella enterica TaxID=28901 RepID=A0A5U3D1T4_SALDZ|nr:hypothetical protein [Salmonella enterica subsp. enterica serovar Redlands]EAA8666308.1 hypothetical protein [Salmonella enterica]EBP3413043.1 hypothetical protein [Salmonella enterica subsp. diarizonae]EBP3905548.1 hypothetical protein [Salmonella enterica subsp. enterica]EBW8696987.1 hypothetical protein [Salmonella enterica subsp. diarizonae serovar 16:z10:e,n,x,z15]ECD6767016.1 hypothetical protein [Salmonella enterica subsp. enterica serovar Newport]EHC5874344.1 DUF4837 family protein
MESVLDALKAMGKATAREIAARLDIEVRDALEMLSEQQELGAVEFQNGYWWGGTNVQELMNSVPGTVDTCAESDTVRGSDNVTVALTDSHQDSLTLPTPKEISRVIRKLRNALRQAEQVRKIAIAAKKHEKSMSRMTRLLQELQQ